MKSGSFLFNPAVSYIPIFFLKIFIKFKATEFLKKNYIT